MSLDIHTHQFSFNAIFNVIVGEENKPKSQKYSLGIHPWFIKDYKKQIEFLESELQQEDANFILIGECGLDKLKGADFQHQKEVFVQQIRLSEKYKKPLIIHCVKSYGELMEIYTKENPTQNWVIHGFNKSKELAHQLISKGIFLSFGATLLKSSKQQEALLDVPLSQLFLETDNQTVVSIEELYTFVSNLLGIEITALKKQIESNLWKVIG